METGASLVIVHPDDASASRTAAESFHRALPSESESAGIGLLVLSRSLIDSPGLLASATEHLAGGHRLIIVTLSPLEDGLLARVPAAIQSQQWLDASRFTRPDLDEAMAAAVSIDPTIASRVGKLQLAARQWVESGRHPHQLISFHHISEWGDILRAASQSGTNLVDPASQEFLIASQLHAPQARRRHRMTVFGVAASLLVLAIVASLGLIRAEQQQEAAEAAELSRRAGELASRALEAVARLDPVAASQAALEALATADTQQTRETARIVAAVPWPQVTVPVKEDQIANAAWAPSGRYLAIATKSGTVKLLDREARAITRTTETGRELTALVFAPTSAGTRLAVRTRDGGWVQLRWDLPEAGDPGSLPNWGRSSDDGRLTTTLARGGVLAYAPTCTRTLKEVCGWWLPAPGASAVRQIRWMPGRHIVALVSSEAVSVHDLERLSQVVLTQPAPSNGIGADQIAWLSYATGSEKTIVATHDGQLFLGDPRQQWGALGTPCIQAVLALPPDCRGKQPERVELKHLLAALDPLSKVYMSPASSSSRPNKPSYEVSADGSRAFVLDVNSRLHLLAMDGGRWTDVLAEPIGEGGLSLAGAAFSAEGSTAAAIFEDAHVGRHVAIFDQANRSVLVRSLPESASGDLIEVAADGTRVRFAGWGAIGNTSDVSGWYSITSGVWEANSTLGSEVGRDGAGRRMLLSGPVTAHEAWPESVKADGRGAWTYVLRIVDATTGELYCESPTYQPPSGLVTDPGLKMAFGPSWNPVRGVRLCDPDQDPRELLRGLLGSVVDG